MENDNSQKLFFLSLALHIVVVAIFIISFERSAHNFVLENSDSSQIVNAIFVNPAKIQLPEPSPFPSTKTPPAPKPLPPKEMKKIEKETPPQKKTIEPIVQKKTIAIPDPKKKLKDIEKQLLADIADVKRKKKKTLHKQLEKEFQKELKASTLKTLEQQLLSEKNRLSSAQTQKMQGIIDKYKALILQAIAQHWLVPSGVDKRLSTELLIRVAPGGTVLDVQLVKSSGDDALDRSAQSAVFKASPLPVPTDSDELEPFRQFILKVKPENVVTREILGA